MQVEEVTCGMFEMLESQEVSEGFWFCHTFGFEFGALYGSYSPIFHARFELKLKCMEKNLQLGFCAFNPYHGNGVNSYI